jgi:hypothetical protein
MTVPGPRSSMSTISSCLPEIRTEPWAVGWQTSRRSAPALGGGHRGDSDRGVPRGCRLCAYLVHVFSPVDFTPTNALVALMLLTSLLRELEEQQIGERVE